MLPQVDDTEEVVTLIPYYTINCSDMLLQLLVFCILHYTMPNA